MPNYSFCLPNGSILVFTEWRLWKFSANKDPRFSSNAPYFGLNCFLTWQKFSIPHTFIQNCGIYPRRLLRWKVGRGFRSLVKWWVVPIAFFSSFQIKYFHSPVHASLTLGELIKQQLSSPALTNPNRVSQWLFAWKEETLPAKRPKWPFALQGR